MLTAMLKLWSRQIWANSNIFIWFISTLLKQKYFPDINIWIHVAIYLLDEVHLGDNLPNNYYHTQNLKLLPLILIFPSPLTSPKTLWRKLTPLTLSLSATLQYYFISEQPKIASASGKNRNKNVSFDVIIYTLLGYRNSVLHLSKHFLFK